MANAVIETNAKYISKLSMNGVAYTINDAWARAEIAEIESAIAGGVHFRGITTTAIADGDNKKDLTVGDNTYTAASQVDGDIFIYNNGSKNLEFVVVNGKYSEFGSTGTLGAFAYANKGSGSVEVPIASAITFNTFTPDVSKGTLSVTTTTGDGLTVTTTATAASVTATAPSATASAPTATVTVNAPSATASAPTATVTVDAPTASVTVAAPTINVTNTTGTFSALTFSTYDEPNATLTITTAESSSFWTGATITADAPTATVTVDAPTASVTVEAPSVTVQAPTASVTVEAPSITVQAPTVTVTYDKASGTTGTYLSAASLTGDLAVTGAAPTATITNPTITVTVDPVQG